MRALSRVSAALAALAVLALTPACSLLGLDKVPRPACRSHDDCASLNAASGIGASACERYQCNGAPLAPGVSPALGLQAGTCELGPVDLDRDGSHPLALASCAARFPGERWDDCDDQSDLVLGGGAELCDGLDNDCDFLVDEANIDPMTAERREAITPETGVAVSPLSSARAVSITASGEDGVGVAWSTTMDRALYAQVPPGGRDLAGAPMTYMAHASQVSLRDSMTVAGCPIDAGGMVVAGACNFADVATDATETHVFVLAVNRTGCARGEMRAGHFDRGTAPALLARGPARRSSSFLGLPLVDCVAPIPGLDDPRPPGTIPGAARPAVSAIDRAGVVDDEALGAWINDQYTRPECGGAEAPVVANVFFLQETLFSTTFQWVTASNEGTPETLGTTIDGSAPSIAPFGQRGWFVAHADGSGQIAIHFVPVQATPAVTGIDDDPLDRTGVEVPPLTGVQHYPVFQRAGGTAASAVQIAVGRILAGGSDSLLELVVAWREGCSADTQTLWTRRIVVDTATATIVEADSDAPAQVASASRPAGAEPAISAPAIVATEGGLLRQSPVDASGMPITGGPIRPGTTTPATITSASDGGWVVAWSEGTFAGGGRPAYRTFATRFSQYDGLAVSEGERILLTPGTTSERMGATTLYRTGDEVVRFATTDLAGGRVLEGQVTCVIPQCSADEPMGRCSGAFEVCVAGVCREACRGSAAPDGGTGSRCTAGRVCGESGFCE